MWVCDICEDDGCDWTVDGSGIYWHKSCVKKHVKFPDSNRDRRASENILEYGRPLAK